MVWLGHKVTKYSR